MNYSPCVGRRDRRACLAEDQECLFKIELPLSLHLLAKVLAFKELHHQISYSFFLCDAEVGNGDCIGMTYLCRGPSLAPEALDCVLVGRQIRMKNLDRNRVFHLHVGCAINGAHSAFADFFIESVLVVEQKAHEFVRRALILKRRAVEGTEHKLILQLAFTVRALFHPPRSNLAETGFKIGMIVPYAHGTVKQLIFVNRQGVTAIAGYAIWL